MGNTMMVTMEDNINYEETRKMKKDNQKIKKKEKQKIRKAAKKATMDSNENNNVSDSSLMLLETYEDAFDDFIDKDVYYDRNNASKKTPKNPPTLIDCFMELHKKDDEQTSKEMQERRKFVFDEYKGNFDMELLSPTWKNMNTILLVTYVYLLCCLVSILLHYQPYNPSDVKLQALLFGSYKYLYLGLIYATFALLLKLSVFQRYLPNIDSGLSCLGFRRRYVYGALIVFSGLYLCVGLLSLSMSMDLVKRSNQAQALAAVVLSMSSLVYQRWFDALDVLTTPLVFTLSSFAAFVVAAIGARLSPKFHRQPMTIRFID